ncbi:MAG TPA: CDP-alcohol phosphatidyltransferase family protein [Alphaproteobacteria bacterium]|nr:CDP-alcohol phosphatidyltransferase family protein [Alphaproteobacteria bacterium]
MDALKFDTRRAVAIVAIGLLLSLLLIWFAGMFAPVQVGSAIAVYSFAVVPVLRGLDAHRPHTRFGVANWITLVRAGSVALLAGALAAPVAAPLVWIACVVGFVGLIGDGIDGWAARRSGLASRFGARFDMEVDAFLILVLCALLVRIDKLGAWILTAGALRYVFVAAGALLPALRAELPPSARRRAICAIQTATLAAALAPPIAGPAAAAIAGAGLVAVIYSFAADVIWLIRIAQSPGKDSCVPT